MHLDILQPNKAQIANLFTILILNRAVQSTSFRNSFLQEYDKVRRVVNVLASLVARKCVNTVR